MATSAKGESKGLEHLHLVTYELTTMAYTDHGPIFLADGTPPTYVNSLAVGKDGHVYFLGKLASGLTDLMRVPDPTAATRKRKLVEQPAFDASWLT